MPAAAVIPALIAYIKVVAVKKLVVGSWDWADCRPMVGRFAWLFFSRRASPLIWGRFRLDRLL